MPRKREGREEGEGEEEKEEEEEERIAKRNLREKRRMSEGAENALSE